MSKLQNWSLDYWLADRLVHELRKLTNRSSNFTNVSQIGPSVKSQLTKTLTWRRGTLSATSAVRKLKKKKKPTVYFLAT